MRADGTANSTINSGSCSGSGSGSIPASRFVGLVLPMLPANHTIYHLRKGWHAPFREPLGFIVMGVMIVISLYLWGFRMAVP